MQVLSSMVTAPGTFLQRCSVSLPSGEHMTLTFELRLEDSLQPSYRGFRVRTPLVPARMHHLHPQACPCVLSGAGHALCPLPPGQIEAVVSGQLLWACLRMHDWPAFPLLRIQNGSSHKCTRTANANGSP